MGRFTMCWMNFERSNLEEIQNVTPKIPSALHEKFSRENVDNNFSCRSWTRSVFPLETTLFGFEDKLDGAALLLSSFEVYKYTIKRSQKKIEYIKF